MKKKIIAAIFSAAMLVMPAGTVFAQDTGFSTGTYNTGESTGFTGSSPSGISDFNDINSSYYNTNTATPDTTGNTNSFDYGFTNPYSNSVNTPSNSVAPNSAYNINTNTNTNTNTNNNINNSNTQMHNVNGAYTDNQPQQNTQGRLSVTPDAYIVQDGSDLWLVMGSIKAKLSVLIYTDPNMQSYQNQTQQQLNSTNNSIQSNSFNEQQSYSNDKNSLLIPILDNGK